MYGTELSKQDECLHMLTTLYKSRLSPLSPGEGFWEMCGEEYGERHSSYTESFLKTRSLFKDSSPLLAGIALHGCVVQRSPQVPRQRLSKEDIAHGCWEMV